MGSYDNSLLKDQSKKGWLTSILELGAWIGTLLSGFMAETIGRKHGILVAVTVFIVGVVIQATAMSGGHNSILGGRFITYVPFSAISPSVSIAKCYNAKISLLAVWASVPSP